MAVCPTLGERATGTVSPAAHQRQQLKGDGDAASGVLQQLPQPLGQVFVLEGCG